MYGLENRVSSADDVREPGIRRPERGRSHRRVEGDAGPSLPARGPADERLIRLMEEFRTRQRKCPNLVVRPWWTPYEPSDADTGGGATGFVVEYCPGGVESAELAVRRDRVRVEGPAGVAHATVDLDAGWILDGEDRRCQETMANYLLRMADRLLGEEAA